MPVLTASQCRAARALLDLTQPALAKAAGVGLSTVVDFERTRRLVSEDAEAALREALEGLGVVFISPKGCGPGVHLRQPER
jgi:transcriptional regulator with XRE-family HTH domain